MTKGPTDNPSAGIGRSGLDRNGLDRSGLAVLVSGNGSNLQAILDAIDQGKLEARVRLVVSNVPGAHALQRAQRAGVPTCVIEEKNRALFEQQLIAVLEKAGVDWIVLAGFMRVLSPDFVQRYRNRVLNIHPSLLPVFPGMDAILQAWKAGVKETGCTVHWIDEGVDTGPIIGQRKVEVRPTDTLETLTERVHQAEHELYPMVLQQLVQSGGRK